MSSSAARARDDDQLVVGALLPAVHGRFTSSRSYLSPDLSSSYRVAFIILSCDPTAGTSPPRNGRAQTNSQTRRQLGACEWLLACFNGLSHFMTGPTRTSASGEV
jgi:hypothetical protein